MTTITPGYTNDLTDPNFDTALEFSRLRVPLLVIQSADDERMPVDDAIRCVPSCPSAELQVVSGLGHRRTARDPEVVKAIGAYLADDFAKSLI